MIRVTQKVRRHDLIVPSGFKIWEPECKLDCNGTLSLCVYNLNAQNVTRFWDWKCSGILISFLIPFISLRSDSQILALTGFLNFPSPYPSHAMPSLPSGILFPQLWNRRFVSLSGLLESHCGQGFPASMMTECTWNLKSYLPFFSYL